AGGTPGTVNSVFNNSPDVVGPVLQTVSALDSLHVELCFDESIDPALLGNILSYTINPAIGNPVSLSYDTATLRCVTLALGTSLTNNSNYQVVFSTLTDCAGNPASPNSGFFSYHKVQPFDVIINEIMADPDPVVQLPDEEYLELHNTTSFGIDLSNWTVSAGTTTCTLPAIILPADSFVVLTSPTAAPLFTGINVAGVTSFPSLTNTGASLTLRNQNGMVIHNVTYSDTWYQNTAKSGGGWSLEQIDPLNPCGGASNWMASNSTMGGTPGRRNSVDANNADLVRPHLLRVSVLAADSIRLYFSEPLDSSTMTNILLYSIDNSIGNPLSVRPIATDFSKCDLKLPLAISSGITYTVTANVLISDCVGNQLAVPNTAPFALPQGAVAGDLVINEILFDPNVGGTDFVEIYNNSQKVIDLKNMLLCSQDTIANTLTELNVIAPEGYLLFPGQYLVLSESSAAVAMQYPIPTDPDRCLEMANIPAMNVSGDIVVLADTGFHIIDRLVYLPSWHFPLLQITKGVSLERIDFNRPTQDQTNWHSASETAGFATPTQQNSEYNPSGADDGAVGIAEQIFSPDGDGFNDVVNIDYNFTEPGYVGTITIFDARGRLVRTLIHSELLGTGKGTFSWDGTMDDRTKARVGAYVIYFEVFSADGKTKKYKRSCVLAAKLQ
ncbi:MAG TPA: lamin tail domain-containing protein, partial [Bacteroidia bacterium]|nr:lamin tail domain-containing protein [Bacteroidia bacterium]